MPGILAIDPGTMQSGWVHLVGGSVAAGGVAENEGLLSLIDRGFTMADRLAIEMIANQGRSAVGQDVFDTCVWIGQFKNAWGNDNTCRLIYRRDVKNYICGYQGANDANIRQALIDMFPRIGGGKVPQIGIKAKPGPLYGMRSHMWSALAVAITAEAKFDIDQPTVRRAIADA